MKGAAFESRASLDLGNSGPAELARGEDQDSRTKPGSVLGGDGPAAFVLVEPRLGDLGAEADLGTKPVTVRHPAEIAQYLGLLRIGPGPIRVGREGIGIKVRGYVAGTARIAIAPPGAAEFLALLD